jgi:crotonobetainyl-CoA:carnitine CoA-transferase CaiB-like acyl-CoA transferase
LPRSHTQEILGGLLAMDEDEIARLKKDGVI